MHPDFNDARKSTVPNDQVNPLLGKTKKKEAAKAASFCFQYR